MLKIMTMNLSHRTPSQPPQQEKTLDCMFSVMWTEILKVSVIDAVQIHTSAEGLALALSLPNPETVTEQCSYTLC